MTAAAPPKAGRREWIGLAVLALPCLLYAMDLTVLNLAVPSLAAALPPSATAPPWIIDIYGFLVAGLADHHGHAGRSHRPPPPPHDRRGRVRRGVGAGGILDQPGDAHRRPRAARARRRHCGAFDAVVQPQHVPRSKAPRHDGPDLDRQVIPRPRHPSPS